VVVIWVRPLWRSSTEQAQYCECRACRLMSNVRSLANAMQSIPCWEPLSRPAGQEIPYILLAPRVRCSVQKSPQIFLILSQMIPFHTLPAYLFKSRLVVIRYLQPFRTVQEVSLVRFGSVFTPESCINYYFLPCMPYTLPCYRPWCDPWNIVWQEIKIFKLLILHDYVIFSTVMLPSYSRFWGKQDFCV